MKRTFNKKAQAILPFFALNLVALLIFLVVLLSVLTMSKNLRFTLDEFNAQTLPLIAQRRLLSSADCFASEEKDMVFNNGVLLTGSRVYPGLIDVDKLEDMEYFNCLRKDTYDIDKDFYKKNGNEPNWDASLGSGATFRYEINAYDSQIRKVVFTEGPSPVNAEYETEEVNSIVIRGDKDEQNCNDIASKDVCNAYNKDWDCIQDCSDNQEGIPGGMCQEGRCEFEKGGTVISEGGWQGWFYGVGTGLKPWWSFNDPEFTIYGTHMFDVQSGEFGEPLHWKSDTVKTLNEKDYTFSCQGQPGATRTILPVMLKYDSGAYSGQIHPGVLILTTCVLKGDKYDGMTILDKLVIAPPSEEDKSKC